jgi:hypothetical protein
VVSGCCPAGHGGLRGRHTSWTERAGGGEVGSWTRARQGLVYGPCLLFPRGQGMRWEWGQLVEREEGVLCFSPPVTAASDCPPPHACA